MDRWEDIAMLLAQVARDLSDQDSTQATLDGIVRHATSLVDGCTDASIMMVRKGNAVTLVGTSETAMAADRLQRELREGPCFDAVVRKEEVYRLADTSDTSHWETLAVRLKSMGIGSVMGFLLHASDNDNHGALNLYGSAPAAFTPRSERVGWVVASHCAIALATAKRDDALQRALRNSRAIGVAVGILMVRHRATEEQAFELLSRYSQTRNVPVRELAEKVTLTGDLP